MTHIPQSNCFPSIPRRAFLQGAGATLGTAALATLLAESSRAGQSGDTMPLRPHAAPRARNVISIVQAGGPAQMELYDYKPELWRRHGEEFPRSLLAGQRMTGFTAGQKAYPIAAPSSKFVPRGETGVWLSELLPHLGTVVDELCFVHSLRTEAVNHDPAVTLLLTGSQQPGRPSLGAWLSYGLGSENSNLPAFVVLLAPGQIAEASTPLSVRHWGPGFLPSQHQGVKFRAGSDPVLYLSNPPGIDAATRRAMIETGAGLNRQQAAVAGDPEIETRIAQYELAFRMQSSVPALTDLSGESDHTFERYGPQSRTPGTFAFQCLLARRLVETGVRFVQIFDRDWDHHRNTPTLIRAKTLATDQPLAALISDLRQRGLLEETLVVCGGEFGRTVYTQGSLQENYGRDHHGGCFTSWLAGGGIRPGIQYGTTDDYSFQVVENPVEVHDLNATLLACLGIDHERLTFTFQGRRHRLTDVQGKVVQGILA